MSEHTRFFALGLGLPTLNTLGEIIEVYYPHPIHKPSDSLVELILPFIDYQNDKAIYLLNPQQCANLTSIFMPFSPLCAELIQGATTHNKPLVLTLLEQDTAPQKPADAFLKLQLLSHRYVKPHDINLTGLFGTLINLAWTSEGPIQLNELAQRQMQARIQGRTLIVFSVDKFPSMANYIIPEGVRIADASRVRLGAHVGAGTTVMHEGFINFNAGTHGASMVEGRISAGVMVGKNSDIGGGASIMGTLSGGGQVTINVGENSLIGANAGLGFPLGDRCIIEAGLYVTASSKVTLLDQDGQVVKQIKALELSHQSDLLFRRNSTLGRIECLSNKTAIELNEALHKN